MTPEIAISGPRRIPLGVGVLLGESFSILFRHFFAVLLLGFLPSLFGHYLTSVVVDLVVANELFGTTSDAELSPLPFGVMILIGLSVYTVTTALLVQLVYDVKLHRPVRLLRYVRPAMRSVIPLTLSCIAFIALLLAIISPIELFDFSVWTMLVIVFPAISVIVLFLGAVFCVTAPAIAIERAGWKGLGRSASLTRSYRLPISGALFLMSVIYFLISTAGSMTLVMGMPNDYYSFGPLLMVSLPTTIATVLLAILTSLIYARLRELKEGVSVDHLANVFE